MVQAEIPKKVRDKKKKTKTLTHLVPYLNQELMISRRVSNILKQPNNKKKKKKIPVTAFLKLGGQ